MNNEIIKQQPLVVIDQGSIWTTSLMVADKFDKEHFNVLQSIERLECSKEFNDLNFQAISYKDSMNREQKAYRVTKDGFMLLGMGFTGPRAMVWKEAFISAFNEATTPRSMSTLDMLEMSIQVSREHEARLNVQDNKITAIDEKVDRKIEAIEKRFNDEQINVFPDGCSKLPYIVDTWFPTMSPAVVSEWLTKNRHPMRPYKKSLNAESEIRETRVFTLEGIPELREKLRKTSTHYKTTPMNHCFYNPLLDKPFRIKIESNLKCWMPLDESVIIKKDMN